jgi:hypothetical protein
MWELSARFPTGTPAILTLVFRGFLSPSRRAQGPRLGRGGFFPNPLKIIIHLSPYHPTLYSLDTEENVVK